MNFEIGLRIKSPMFHPIKLAVSCDQLARWFLRILLTPDTR